MAFLPSVRDISYLFMTALWKVLKLVDGVLVIHAGLACFNEEQIGGRRERNVDGSMIDRVVCHH